VRYVGGNPKRARRLGSGTRAKAVAHAIAHRPLIRNPTSKFCSDPNFPRDHTTRPQIGGEPQTTMSLPLDTLPRLGP
jgi:hypothetical protein